MARILADLPDEDIRWLDARAAEQGKSRASVLREAVSAYRAETGEHNLGWLDAGFGLWVRHGVEHHADEYDQKRLAEWTRPWDDDFEAVRASAPAWFHEDDRQREIYLDMIAGTYPSPRKPSGQ